MGGPNQTLTSPLRTIGGGSSRSRILVAVRVSGFNYGAPVAWPVRGKRLVIGREPDAGGLVIEDPEVSRAHIVLEHVPGQDVYRVYDPGSRNGSFLNGQALTSDYLTNGSVLRLGDSLVVYAEVEDHPGLPSQLPDSAALSRGRAEQLADLAAPTGAPVLIIGPTGAGKERLVSRIHERSGRHGNLASVNCATFSTQLIASELFGHVRGAFSGADQERGGLFRSAQGGTVFLDEIAELPLAQQASLLRAVQEGRVRPVGSDREVEVDARLVAATNVDLESRVDDGEFRPDLYARLAGITVRLAGLAQRREEILSLFAELAEEDLPPMTLLAAEAMLLYDWPRNVRELQHVAKQMRMFAPNIDMIDLQLLPIGIQQVAQPQEKAVVTSVESIDGAPSKVELEHLLTEHRGRIAQVAQALGKHRQQIYRWLRAYGLDAHTFRNPG